jgi:hypothetical protein
VIPTRGRGDQPVDRLAEKEDRVALPLRHDRLAALDVDVELLLIEFVNLAAPRRSGTKAGPIRGA